jgi:anti-sigma B factor antagonist
MSEPPFHYYLRSAVDQGVLVLTILEKQLRGDDLADAMRQELILAVEHYGIVRVVLDFQNVEYLSSAGIRPLLGLHRHLKDKNGRMVLCNLPPIVKDTLNTLRLIGTSRSSAIPFETAADVPSAVASLTRTEAEKTGA